jgi:hypothetical protein
VQAPAPGVVLARRRRPGTILASPPFPGEGKYPVMSIHDRRHRRS